jgi:hypothetical protein
METLSRSIITFLKIASSSFASSSFIPPRLEPLNWPSEDQSWSDLLFEAWRYTNPLSEDWLFQYLPFEDWPS